VARDLFDYPSISIFQSPGVNTTNLKPTDKRTGYDAGFDIVDIEQAC